MSSSDRAARPRPIAWFWRVGGFVAAFLGATMLARGARFALTGRARLPAGPSASAEPYFLLYRGTGVAAVLAATWFTLRLLDRRPFSDIGLGGGVRAAARDVAKGAALVSAIFVAGFACLAAAGQVRIISVGPDWRAVLLQAIPATALVALYEELVFRGYPFQVLVQRFRPVTAICASALAFGWLHYWNPGMTLVGAVATGLWGVLLCTLVVRSRSLWTCIGFHFAGNFVQNTVLGSPTSGMTFGTSMLTVEMAPTVFAGSPSGVEASVPVLLAGAIALGWILRSGSWAPRPGAGVLFSSG